MLIGGNSAHLMESDMASVTMRTVGLVAVKYKGTNESHRTHVVYVVNAM